MAMRKCKRFLIISFSLLLTLIRKNDRNKKRRERQKNAKGIVKRRNKEKENEG